MEEIDVLPYPQNGAYGCGLFSVAHACNLGSLITPHRIEESRLHGNTIGQLSKWLQEDGNPWYIEVMYYDHLGNRIPDKHLDLKPEGEVNFLPVCLTVRLKDGGLNHMIAGKIDKEGNFFLYDSMKTHILKTTLRAVNEAYEFVYGLFIFADVNTSDYLFIL